MNAETMQRACLELPAGSLRIVKDLVMALGGKFYPPGSDEEKVYVEPQIPEVERVGRMLKGARLRAGMTQKDLAAKIGVPQGHISDYERNKRNISAEKAVRLAEILETVPGHFQQRY